MNLNSPGPDPGLPQRPRTFPAGEMTVTRSLRPVTYRLPSGLTAKEWGWLSPSEAAEYWAVTANGVGSVREAGLAELGLVPFAVAFPVQAAVMTASPAAAAATAMRVVILSMVPP